MLQRSLHLAVLAVVSLTGIVACGPKSVETGPDAASAIVFPPEPDTARIQFLVAFGDSRDFETGSSSFLDAVTGQSSETKRMEPIVKPYGAAMHDGRIYVCDSARPGIEVLDLVANRFEVWETAGDGSLMQPINCTIDPDFGHLYVADNGRNEVVVFDSTGSFQWAFGHEDLRSPVDAFIDGDRVYVASLRGNSVTVFDKKTRLPVDTLPNAEPGSPESLFQPTNIWVAGDELYVSDFGDFKVKVYTTDGEFVRSVGKYGNGMGMFVRPKGIAVDDEGILYAVDSGFQNVQMFNETGDLLMYFGGPYAGPGTGTMYLPAKVTIHYEGIELFRDRIHPDYEARYLILVVNQYGQDKVSLYARIEPKPGAPVGRGLENPGTAGE